MNIRNITIKVILITGFAFVGLQACKHEVPEPVPPITPPDTIPTGGGGGGCNPDTVYFYNTILPLIRSNCAMPGLGCHDAETDSHDVVLTSHRGIMEEVKAKNLDGSKLYEMITEDERDEWMPLNREKLDQDKIDLIEKWIMQGALPNKCDDECDTTNITYTVSIAPILNNNCIGCHNAADNNAGILLHNYSEAKSAAATGRLYGAVSHQSGFTPMPYGGDKLDNCKVELIKKWIDNNMPQ